MNRTLRFPRTVTVALTVAITAASASCTMKSQEAPPLTGPSEFGTSIVVTVSPDVLTLDGASQSLVTVTARDGSGNPVRNLSLRAEIAVGGVRADFGSLSARNLVTGSDGRATLVYTAPAAPAGPSVDPNTTVDILVTPLGTNAANSATRLASIRLVAPGVVIPADGLQPYFTASNLKPTDHETVLFDACNDPQKPPCASGNNPIASYLWNFGDGRTASGRSVSHAFNDPGTYVVTLTVADQFNRTASTSQTITVGGGAGPSASFLISPAAPRVGENVNFNASASRPAAGRTIRTYDWDFGDGEQKTTTTPITSHDYQTAGTFAVTLLVTDDAGRATAASGSVTVGTDAPTAEFSYSPTTPAAGAPVTFNGNASSAISGRTIVSWAWDFPGGTPASSAGATPTTRFTFAGTYNVTLTVTDSAGKIGRVTKTVTVQ
jgi:PKD repeat protein